MSTTYYSNYWNKAIEEDVMTMRVAERGKDMDKLPTLYPLYPRMVAKTPSRRLSVPQSIPSHSSRPSRTDAKGNLHVTIGDKPTDVQLSQDTVQKVFRQDNYTSSV